MCDELNSGHGKVHIIILERTILVLFMGTRSQLFDKPQ